ncbi:MAG: MBL fold metallo-hydrolase [Treponema sp.]|uniref:MBL fold metallo-hydrolase n=1 Tax=Treponema sp. TaxID=166 RepID=UPI0025F023CE|nr:MBL fold metallo-hydrolase [Treponema sp.]MBQ9281591.1 MBL fold metallo-hydrolase [Treponema sp.]
MSVTTEQLVTLSEHISYLSMPTNIGFIRFFDGAGKDCVYLIDSGNDETTGARILDFIKANFPDATLKAIINTHSHADHCGGNSYLVRETGCEVWASKGEAYLMEYPTIETQLIWGGTPIHDLRSKYLLAEACQVQRVFDGEEEISLSCENGEIRLKVISLPGHYVDQVGFLLTDTDGKRVMFAGDVLSGRNSIKKHWIQYLLDETKTKESLLKIQTVEADFYIPGHGDIVDNIEGIAELNLLAILETEDMIVDELRSPKSSEELLKAVADRSGITLKTSQFCLIGSTLRSYLTGLYESGRIEHTMEANRMLWRKIS